jgi:8-oxo-dGTP pyrophosphatase MutT (NUDIX family)
MGSVENRNERNDPKITLKQRRLAFENARFRVFKDHIVDSQGVEVRDYLVVAPHTRRDDLITGISVLPVWNDCVALVRVFRHAIGRVQLEVPRGFVDTHEDPRAAALRELSEETGLHCTEDKLVSLGVCTPEGSTLAARIALFAATECHPGGSAPEEELGLGKCEYFALPDALRMLREMSIEDVTTALILHRFFQLRHA